MPPSNDFVEEFVERIENPIETIKEELAEHRDRCLRCYWWPDACPVSREIVSRLFDAGYEPPDPPGWEGGFAENH